MTTGSFAKLDPAAGFKGQIPYFCSRLIVYSEESVPLFGPPLPLPSVFEDPLIFRDFLLVKREAVLHSIPCFVL